MSIWKWVCIFIAQVVLLTGSLSAQADESPTIYQQIENLAESYKGEPGVASMVCNGGFKLQTVKMMLRKEFGKEFVDNIKAFAIIFYKDAKGDVAEKIVSQVGQIAAPLRSVNIDAQLKKGATGVGYVNLSDDGKVLTDLLIVMESPSPKLIYFRGNFDPANVQYNKQETTSIEL